MIQELARVCDYKARVVTSTQTLGLGTVQVRDGDNARPATAAVRSHVLGPRNAGANNPDPDSHIPIASEFYSAWSTVRRPTIVKEG
jgi:hypothetical protein